MRLWRDWNAVFRLEMALNAGSNGAFHFLSRWKTVCRSEDDDCLLFDAPEMEVDSGEWKLKFRGGGNVEIEQ